jgi:hypothetical protein
MESLGMKNLRLKNKMTIQMTCPCMAYQNLCKKCQNIGTHSPKIEDNNLTIPIKKNLNFVTSFQSFCKLYFEEVKLDMHRNSKRC